MKQYDTAAELFYISVHLYIWKYNVFTGIVWDRQLYTVVVRMPQL